MRRVVLCLVGLMALAGAGWAASGQEPRATLDGATMPGLSVAVFDGVPFVPLASLRFLQARVVFDRAAGFAAIGVAGRTLTLTAGSAKVTIDGQTVEMQNAPRVEKGDLWFPAAYLGQFLLKVTWDQGASTLSLNWAKPYLLRAYLDETGISPRLVLEATGEIEAAVFALVKPDRLVVDLSQLVAYDFLALDDRENEYFQGLRAAQNRPGVLRFVADLKQSVGYRVDMSQAKSGRLSIDLNTLVYGVAIVPAEEGRKLVVIANVRPEWKAVALADPDRVVVEFSHVTLTVPAGTAPGDGDWLRRAEWRPVGVDQVQVVAFLARPQGCAIAAAPGHDNLIELQPLQILGKLAWRESANEFTLASSGALVFTTAVEHYPERLVLNVFHATAAAEEGQPAAGPVSRYRVSQAGPGLVQFVFDLRYDAPCSIETSDDRHRITARFQPSPLAGKVIVLDAGHGGIETGALGRTLGLREKDINLDVTLRVKEMLEGAGASVYLTRVDDTYVPLFARPSFANRLPAEIFVSIHTNAHDDPAVNGVEVFYYPEKEEDRRLAGLMLEEMVTVLALLPRGAKPNDFAVLRDSQVLSVLIEIGFLSNAHEEARLATEEFRSRAAQALFRALTRFARGESAATGLPVPGLTN